MLTYYLSLDLLLDASNEEIRNKYIELVKKYTPEKNPERFQKITEAYEAIKDERSRIRSKIFIALDAKNYEDALFALARAKVLKRRRVGLQELIQETKE
jgi:curved DNA-binding protein CbpA